MVRKIFFAFLYFFISNLSTVSQEKNKDSLFYESVKNKANKFISKPYFKKASSFFYKNDWDSTLIYSDKQLSRQKNNKTLQNYCHFFRGFSFEKKEILEKSIEEFNIVTSEFIFYNIVRMRLGEIALKQGKFKKAIPYFKEILKFPNNNELYIKRNAVIQNLGVSHLHIKQFNDAEFYFNKSIKLYKEEKDTIHLVAIYGNVATLYYEQYKDNLAIPYFEKAYKLAKKTKNFDLKRTTAKNMAVIEENRKDFLKALVYRKEMERWKDSLNDQNKIYEVAKLEKEFAVKEKQKEVDILQVRNELQATQRNIFLYAAIGLLILLSISFYFYREKVKRNKIIAHQKENLDILNATKDKLFSIVSHDLRSSVNALKNSNSVLLDNLASKNIVALGNLLKKNSAIVNGAYGLLDNLLHWALSQTKQGYFEITATRLFFMVEQMAYNYKPLMLEKNIQFENKVLKKAIAFADQESLKLVIRNLLDNAIKFSTKDGIIKVYSRNKQEGYCDLIVEDTGMGMSNDTRLKLLEDTLLLSKKEHETVIGTGLGLQLCKTMIKKNNGKFSIESELGIGTKMIVSLPKKQDNG
ncbi:ATP-binding protein [Tenacibaculum ovolyticum]|uniref:ATP-binding protein n=2 Tax=Tenacibaculum ovolyticum TaxID=104270 RepID=UPI001F324CCB|nr:ATP-binding protein [Tenacibaculum ovolyticum]